MKILSILDNQFYLSGVNAFWSSMARALGELGHDVCTLGLDDGSCPWNDRFFSKLSGSSHRLEKTSGSTTGPAVPAMLDLAPDLVIHHYSDFGLDLSGHALGISDHTQWKDVYICHSDDPDHYMRVKTRKGMLDHVICVSDTCRGRIVRELDIRRDDTSLIQYIFIPPNGAGGIAGKKIQSEDKPDTIGILYAGRLESYQKRAGDLVAFARSLEKLDVSFRLDIAGSGTLESPIRQELLQLIEDGAVTVHGYLPEDKLFHLMEGADIYISFSEFEGLSTSLLQAMHHGLIPLITPTKSGSGFLSDKEDALFFNIGDTETAAAYVKKLCRTPQMMAQMVKCVAEKAEKMGDRKAFIHQIESFLMKLG